MRNHLRICEQMRGPGLEPVAVWSGSAQYHDRHRRRGDGSVPRCDMPDHLQRLQPSPTRQMRSLATLTRPEPKLPPACLSRARERHVHNLPHDDKKDALRRGAGSPSKPLAQEGSAGRTSRAWHRARTGTRNTPTLGRARHELRHTGPASPRSAHRGPAPLVAVLAGCLTNGFAGHQGKHDDPKKKAPARHCRMES